MGRRLKKCPSNLSNAEKVRLRDEAIDQILELLAKAPRTVVDIADIVGLPEGTTYGYMRYLAETGEARRSGEVGKANRHLWELGREDQPLAERRPANLFSGAKVVPARQIGMHRHWLDVALFGPANTQ